MTMRLYETTLIIRPDLDEAEALAIRESVDTQIEKAKATVVRWESWGKRKLAYSINKYPKGIYLYVLYLASADVVAEVERNLRINEDVLRYLSVSVLDNVEEASFDLDGWAAKRSPLAERESDGVTDEAADSSDEAPVRSTKNDGEKMNDSVKATDEGKTDTDAGKTDTDAGETDKAVAAEGETEEEVAQPIEGGS